MVSDAAKPCRQCGETMCLGEAAHQFDRALDNLDELRRLRARVADVRALVDRWRSMAREELDANRPFTAGVLTVLSNDLERTLNGGGK